MASVLFLVAAGSADGAGCLAGSFPHLGACEACPDGAIAAAGAVECTPCHGGFHPNEDQSACVQCGFGSYAPRGAATCSPCDPGSTGLTTLTTGAQHAGLCACPPGAFWSVRDDVCAPCRDGAVCPGGLHLPVARAGRYARYLGSITGLDLARQQKLGAAFDPALWTGAFFDVEVFACEAAHCPGQTLSFDLAAYGLEAVELAGVRAGASEDAPCPARRSGIACAKCEDSYFGEECRACSGSAAVSGVVIALFPVAMLGFYRVTVSSTMRLQSLFILTSTCGMLVFGFQVIGVLGTFAMHWPGELDWIFGAGRVFLFDFRALPLSCLYGNGFAARYWASLLFPVLVVGMVLVAFVLSRVAPLPELWRMQPNQTLSQIGTLASAMSIALPKVVLAYFECARNPAAPDTLANHKEVICGGAEHETGVVPMALGVLAYVLGFNVLYCWSVYRAPVHWTLVEYRERSRFMLHRWRPDLYFWGAAQVARNLLLALVGVLGDERETLLFATCAVVLVYLVLTATYQPWRVPVLNHYEATVCLLLGFTGVAGLVFASADADLALSRSAVQRAEQLQRGFAQLLAVAFGMLLALFGLLAAWALAALQPGLLEQAQQDHERACAAALQLLQRRTKSGTFEQDARRLLEEGTSYDRQALVSFLAKLGVDPTCQVSGTTDTLSIKRLSKERPAPEVVAA